MSLLGFLDPLLPSPRPPLLPSLDDRPAVKAASCSSFLGFMGDFIAFQSALLQIASMRFVGDKELPSRVDVTDIAKMKVSYARGLEPRMIDMKSSLFIDPPIGDKSSHIVWSLIK
jgi:hypothetical protein